MRLRWDRYRLGLRFGRRSGGRLRNGRGAPRGSRSRLRRALVRGGGRRRPAGGLLDRLGDLGHLGDLDHAGRLGRCGLRGTVGGPGAGRHRSCFVGDGRLARLLPLRPLPRAPGGRFLEPASSAISSATSASSAASSASASSMASSSAMASSRATSSAIASSSSASRSRRRKADTSPPVGTMLTTSHPSAAASFNFATRAPGSYDDALTELYSYMRRQSSPSRSPGGDHRSTSEGVVRASCCRVNQRSGHERQHVDPPRRAVVQEFAVAQRHATADRLEERQLVGGDQQRAAGPVRLGQQLQ